MNTGAWVALLLGSDVAVILLCLVCVVLPCAVIQFTLMLGVHRHLVRRFRSHMPPSVTAVTETEMMAAAARLRTSMGLDDATNIHLATVELAAAMDSPQRRVSSRNGGVGSIIGSSISSASSHSLYNNATTASGGSLDYTPSEPEFPELYRNQCSPLSVWVTPASIFPYVDTTTGGVNMLDASRELIEPENLRKIMRSQDTSSLYSHALVAEAIALIAMAHMRLPETLVALGCDLSYSGSMVSAVFDSYVRLRCSRFIWRTLAQALADIGIDCPRQALSTPRRITPEGVVSPRGGCSPSNSAMTVPPLMLLTRLIIAEPIRRPGESDVPLVAVETRRMLSLVDVRTISTNEMDIDAENRPLNRAAIRLLAQGLLDVILASLPLIPGHLLHLIGCLCCNSDDRSASDVERDLATIIFGRVFGEALCNPVWFGLCSQNSAKSHSTRVLALLARWLRVISSNNIVSDAGSTELTIEMLSLRATNYERVHNFLLEVEQHASTCRDTLQLQQQQPEAGSMLTILPPEETAKAVVLLHHILHP